MIKEDDIYNDTRRCDETQHEHHVYRLFRPCVREARRSSSRQDPRRQDAVRENPRQQNVGSKVGVVIHVLILRLGFLLPRRGPHQIRCRRHHPREFGFLVFEDFLDG